ncbi:MAG: beta-sandwich domain-containing protein [bacterium]
MVSGKITLLEKTLFGRQKAETVEDVFVYLLPQDDAAQVAVSDLEKHPLKVEWINQVNKTFSPRVVMVQKGSRVRFGNADPWFHNVYSREPTFNLGRYPRGFYKDQEFNETGVSHIFCDIHLDMHAIIVVVDTPLYQRVAPDGSFSIENVSSGTYTLNVWQERATFSPQIIIVQERDFSGLELIVEEQERKHINRKRIP